MYFRKRQDENCRKRAEEELELNATNQRRAANRKLQESIIGDPDEPSCGGGV
jgi:hypothetical protein